MNDFCHKKFDRNFRFKETKSKVKNQFSLKTNGPLATLSCDQKCVGTEKDQNANA